MAVSSSCVHAHVHVEHHVGQARVRRFREVLHLPLLRRHRCVAAAAFLRAALHASRRRAVHYNGPEKWSYLVASAFLGARPRAPDAGHKRGRARRDKARGRPEEKYSMSSSVEDLLEAGAAKTSNGGTAASGRRSPPQNGEPISKSSQADRRRDRPRERSRSSSRSRSPRNDGAREREE